MEKLKKFPEFFYIKKRKNFKIKKFQKKIKFLQN